MTENAVKLLALLTFLAWQPLIWAGEAAYINDQLVVQLRAGKGLDYKILKQLESGTPVTVLQRDSKSGYSKVQLEDGQRGWVLDRFLTEELPARVKLPELERKLQQLSEENKQLKDALTSLTARQAQAASDKGKLSELSARLQSELKRIRKTAAHALEIEAERNQLRERVVLLERELQKVKLEKQALESESGQSWFTIGAGVLFAGIVLGLILPRLGWRRKPGWDSL
ncbi:MAG: hypothetical protein AXA67_09840 [Methylothermaceae bacteria B42]|nr:MAG: hypothetical protein AXA67_09840 [Methylothermaceae bacteria B42]HHJ39605.1 TIGR04211 family SH3 domain-containing protein [Methylothermaceae bacterium]